MIGRVIALLVLTSGLVQAQDAVAPKLEPQPVPTVGSEDTPAQPIPSDVTICIDRTARQCWTASGRVACQSPARPGAEVFDVMPARSTAAGSSLRACWTSATRTVGPTPQL